MYICWIELFYYLAKVLNKIGKILFSLKSITNGNFLKGNFCYLIVMTNEVMTQFPKRNLR